MKQKNLKKCDHRKEMKRRRTGIRGSRRRDEEVAEENKEIK
jgi:hypothetical protein